MGVYLQSTAWRHKLSLPGLAPSTYCFQHPAERTNHVQRRRGLNTAAVFAGLVRPTCRVPQRPGTPVWRTERTMNSCRQVCAPQRRPQAPGGRLLLSDSLAVRAARFLLPRWGLSAP